MVALLVTKAHKLDQPFRWKSKLQFYALVEVLSQFVLVGLLGPDASTSANKVVSLIVFYLDKARSNHADILIIVCYA